MEIESSIPILSKAGIKIHLGKGAISKETISALQTFGSAYAVIPPITALLKDRTLSISVVAYPELGMEAYYKLNIVDFPIIIAMEKASINNALNVIKGFACIFVVFYHCEFPGFMGTII